MIYTIVDDRELFEALQQFNEGRKFQALDVFQQLDRDF